MHSDRYASYEFQQGLHVKEFLSESIFLRYNLGLFLSHLIKVHSVHASVLQHFYALLELGPGFLSAVRVVLVLDAILGSGLRVTMGTGEHLPIEKNKCRLQIS